MNKNFKYSNNLPLLIFTIEGILYALLTNLVNNNNNLFALRLGASDFQVSLVSSLPQFIGVLVLIPIGILTDRMQNKQKVVTTSLLCIALVYLLIGFVPALGNIKLIVFLILLSISIGPMTSYNASWQAYFSDVVPFERRNKVLTLRTGCVFIINIATPFVTGALLASVSDNNQKIRYHQIFYFIGVALLVMQVLTLKRMKEGTRVIETSAFKLSEFKSTLKVLVKHKPFMKFLVVALFFYATWQADWTLFFLGEVNYLHMNEVWISYVSIGSAIAQFVTIGFWSRVNEKFGPKFGIIFTSLGLSLCPVGMIIATSLPLKHPQLIFLIINTLGNLALANTSLSIPQYLLLSIPENNKTLSISIYTVCITLSNAIIPMTGVKVYTILGGNLEALHKVFWSLFVLRLIAATFWFINWKDSKKDININ